MTKFQTHNVTSIGKRGRPAHPKAHSELVERILNDKGTELGSLSLAAQKDGSVILTAMIDGKRKSITFPAAKGRTRKPTVRKAVARNRSRKTQATDGAPA